MDHQGHYVGPVLKYWEDTRTAKQSGRNVTGDFRRAAANGWGKGLKTRERRKPPPPNRWVLQTNNIRNGLGHSKGMKKGEKYIPAPEAVVLKNGKNMFQGPPWGD